MRKYEAGELAGGGPPRVDRRAFEAKVASLERKSLPRTRSGVGQLTMELDLLEKGLTSARRAGGGTSSVVSGPTWASGRSAGHEHGPENTTIGQGQVGCGRGRRAAGRGIHAICAVPSTVPGVTHGSRPRGSGQPRAGAPGSCASRPAVRQARYVVTTQQDHDGPAQPLPGLGPRTPVRAGRPDKGGRHHLHPRADRCYLAVVSAWSRRGVGRALGRIDADPRSRPSMRHAGRQAPAGACTTPTAFARTPRSPTGRSSRRPPPPPACRASTAGAATRTTTPRRRASWRRSSTRRCT